MSPLDHGMLAALTDHPDSNPEKQLSRSSIQILHSGILHAEETSEIQQGIRFGCKLPQVTKRQQPPFPGSGLLLQSPCHRSLLTRGSPQSLARVLRTFQGKAVHWKKVQEQYTPYRYCVLCDLQVFKQDCFLMRSNGKDNLSCCEGCKTNQNGGWQSM